MTLASAPPRTAGWLRAVARVLALLTAASLAWAAVADNAVVCPDDADSHREAQHAPPAGPHCCSNAPCHTPVVVRDVASAAGPEAVAFQPVTSAPSVLFGIDTPAPPTPPPNSFA